MEITNCMNIDANIFLGIANDRLRHECKNLHGLAALLDVDEQKIATRLAEINFHYETRLNQFMPDIK